MPSLLRETGQSSTLHAVAPLPLCSLWLLQCPWQAVQDMRQQVERQGEGLEERKELLQRYFRALSVMEARFPIGPEKPPLSAISFTWQDAFKTTKKAGPIPLAFQVRAGALVRRSFAL